MTEGAVEAEVGRARLRKEDARLLTGQTHWTDNIQAAGMLHLAILRSPMAHARLERVDVSPALELPGVVAAFTGSDLAEGMGSLPCAWPVTEDMVHPDHPPLAVDEVRHAGDPVAVVVARDRYAAADALEAVEVEYEPLPAVLDLEAALAEDAPLVHADKGTNRCYDWPLRAGEDYAAVRERAEVVLERRYHQQRLIPNAMEPRSVVVTPLAASGEYTVYSATQIPHILRVMLAMVTGIPEHKLRVVAPDVGGGFGSKLQVYGEEAIALAVARRLGRPVKWTESRSEGYLATHHGRGMIQDVEIAADRDGRLRGLKVDLLADMGAYLMLVTPGVPILGAFMYPAIYKMDSYEFRCTGVFTTRTPTDAYRGAGRPEATYAIERIMDELAAELGMDPVELRRRNWIRHEEFPYDSIAGLTYDSGNYEAATDKALALFGYDELREEQRKRNERGDTVRLGIGVSTYTEMCGLAPSRVLRDLRYAAGGWEAASIRMLPTGKVEVVTGTSPHGQGHVTSWSQIAADVLGVPFEDVEVVHGDTRAAPQGMDTYGSRSLVVGGAAVHHAARKVVDKARKVAAHLLEASERDLEFTGGVFSVKGSPEARKTIQEVAFEAFTSHDLPDGMEPTINAEHVLDPENFSYPHGTHLCAVEVDTETGMTRIRSYVCVDDVGRVVNPMIVEGQVHGGLAQGIAQALYEEAVYDDDGNLLSGTMADYLVPSAVDLPDFVTDRTETPAESNPLGVKGVGEAGTIASTPAVVGAVVDALRPLGVRDVPMPCTPERVWRAIHGEEDPA
ncbi:xanthine dehydrogenase family protein molybdopterin-binding subunit [Streptomyces cellulosae]|jgi:carbon-monoxide dehydrogenase large subunit|uniref:Carbon-monoxide dehydrogenase large subunit n=1 Tax=Streptomyces thermodiastaticus TaxID=44061 RepID=A0ABU0KRW5_9ACTN|nr:xanthine dehydrogenase family protein molybdopterin-binding subunit [Streptomyces sp. McG7]MBT2902914.1 xanthine dehydrogenase family protein molybdopterin-binding subunit [Streptomyces sp. McG8]MDQ0491033.1 carbon-monoxide dehydrogenase large subunit [Streptomyces thermodiastaticus]MYW50775.1 molybdopterin-dependent oxidoreductase [Streptomyces sp. SID8376]THC58864.1 xanthine dehydrogenase family protein molybdopterin-binding subunit [Streptomyces sp. Akac8]UVT13249.1 xanthine dehydrogenas